MSEKAQPSRWRCLATGCNPVLNAATAKEHNEKTGHRVAKWPVRSAAGKAKAKARNRSGYYDKYRGLDPRKSNGRGVQLSGSDFAWPHGED